MGPVTHPSPDPVPTRAEAADPPVPDWVVGAGPPVLADPVVRLRPLREGDLDAVERACQDPDMVRWTTIPQPYRREHAVDFVHRIAPDGWRTGTDVTWAIADPVDDAYLGAIDLRMDGEAGAEVGYAVAPWARGRGAARHALALACGWGFEVAGVEMVLWLAYAGNDRSRRTATSVGFRVLDEVVRLGITQRGRRVDAWLGDLLPGDLRMPG
jgi:RimJ/RimL family protein N-acetyltransferase